MGNEQSCMKYTPVASTIEAATHQEELEYLTHTIAGCIHNGVLKIRSLDPKTLDTELNTLYTTYGGVLAVDMRNYAASRRDMPLFLHKTQFAEIAQTSHLLILFPIGDSLVKDIYTTYTSIYRPRVNVYELNVTLYRLIDSVYPTKIQPLLLASTAPNTPAVSAAPMVPSVPLPPSAEEIYYHTKRKAYMGVDLE